MSRDTRTATLLNVTIAIALAGCTWVKLTEAGARVEQSSPDQIAGCRLVGNVSATTQDRVVVPRGRGKVAEELIVLARNEAAALGGDTIVPAGPMQDGHQNFNVYRCNLPR